MNDIESLRARAEKAEASLATARRLAEQQASRIIDVMEPALAAAQKRIETLEGALRDVVRDCEQCGWECERCGQDAGMTDTDLCSVARAALASPSEGAPSDTKSAFHEGASRPKEDTCSGSDSRSESSSAVPCSTASSSSSRLSRADAAGPDYRAAHARACLVVAGLRVWAGWRIEQCRTDEAKFVGDVAHEAAIERRTLQAVLERL